MKKRKEVKMRCLKDKNMKVFMLIMMISLFVTGCGRSEYMKKAEIFIKDQVNCETYKLTDEETVKQIFEKSLTPEAYQAYKDNYFLYMYPDFFNSVKAQSVTIKRINCTKKIDNTYIFSVKYTVNTANKKLDMTDNISINMNENQQIIEVMILNTSDLIKKLYLDVKIQ